MLKLIVMSGLFLLTGVAALALAEDRTRVFKAWVSWLLGFAILVAIVLFAQAVVFVWLEWNGTTKNDWFFMLWWVVVVVWFVVGVRRLFFGTPQA